MNRIRGRTALPYFGYEFLLKIVLKIFNQNLLETEQFWNN